MDEQEESRRAFLLAAGAMATSAWLATSRPAVAAHGHAAPASRAAAAGGLGFLNVADALDVEAIAAQILPGGASPGAREAHAVHFIDRALATFFSERAALFRAGLAEFQLAFRKTPGAAESFAAASPAAQIAFLESVERTPFFELVRRLTILGTLCSSQYGGNFEGLGWKLLGFEDQHAFSAPFGYYDREYAA